MTHFAYPNVHVRHNQFLGCGRYAAFESEAVPSDRYQPFHLNHTTEFTDIDRLTARIAPDTVLSQFAQRMIHETKDCPSEVYCGTSKALAYLLARISRARDLKFDVNGDIWCTGSIGVADGRYPTLEPVAQDEFLLKLQAFLADENRDRLFIVPTANMTPEACQLCATHEAQVRDLDASEQVACQQQPLTRKTIVTVSPDTEELFRLIRLVFLSGANPYKGLEFFDRADAALFFGRDELIDKLHKKCDLLRQSPQTSRLLAIFGSSGAGKSSLARAGLLPKLQQAWNLTENDLAAFTPGAAPLAALEQHVTNGMPRVLLIDQFEELYTQCQHEPERAAFVERLTALTDAEDAPAKPLVILTMRDDFRKYLAPELKQATDDDQRHQFVSEMTRAELRQVIVEPAKQAGCVFAEDFVDDLIAQTEKCQGVLPLLEVALQRLWDAMQHDLRVAPEEAFAQIGGLGGALTQQAQRVYAESDDAAQTVTQRLFVSLTQLDPENTHFLRQRTVSLAQIPVARQHPQIAQAIIERFAAKDIRFLTISSSASHETTVELTHDILLTIWPLLKTWTEQDREFQMWRQRLWAQKSEWERHSREKEALLRGMRLIEAENWLKLREHDIPFEEQDFIKTALSVRRREQRQTWGKRFVVVAIVIVVAFTGRWLWKNYHSEALFNKGVSLHKMGETEKAIGVYQELLRITPDYKDAWNLLGNALDAIGRSDEAITAYREQLRLVPDHIQAWNGLGAALYHQGKLDEAIDAFHKQLEIVPHHESAWNWLGNAFYSQGRWNEAVEAYRKQLNFVSDHEWAWSGLGYVLSAQGKWNEAIEAFHKQVAFVPKHREAWIGLGNAYYSQDEWDEAIAAYRTQLDIIPNHDSAWNGLGNAFYAQGKWDEAIDAYRKQLEIVPEHKMAWNGLGNAFYAQKKWDEAIDAYRKQLEIVPEHEMAWNGLGNTFYSQEKWDEAIDAYRKQLEIVPEHKTAWNGLGNTFYAQEKWNEAIAAYNKQLEINPNDKDIWYWLGNALKAEGNVSKAIEAYRKQLEFAPDHKAAWDALSDISFEMLYKQPETILNGSNDSEVWYQLGEGLQLQSKLAEAITAYWKQLKIVPEHHNAWNRLGDTLLKQGKFGEAETAYRKQLEIMPQHYEAWNGLGTVLLNQGKFGEAETAYRKQLEIMPQHREAWNGLGVVLDRQGKQEEAINAYRKQIELMPEHHDAWNGLGLALLHQGKLDEASTAYRKQLEIIPKHRDAWNGLGTALLNQGKLDEASTAYRKQLEIMPQHYEAWNSLGVTLLNQGKFGEAETAYRRQLEIMPQHYEAWNGLGLALLNQGKFDESIKAFSKQVEIIPQHILAWGNLGSAFSSNGNGDEAIKAYQKQIEIVPQHQTAWNGLGLVLFKQGKVEAAITAYRKQLEIVPKNQETWYNLGYALWKQGRLNEAATAFEDGLQHVPESLGLLSNDAELAFVQDDLKRCQERIRTALPLIQSDNELYVILPFYAWLAQPELGWESVMTALKNLKPSVKFHWDFSTTKPVLDRLDDVTRQHALDFIAFFEGAIDLPTLQMRLSEQ